MNDGDCSSSRQFITDLANLSAALRAGLPSPAHIINALVCNVEDALAATMMKKLVLSEIRDWFLDAKVKS